MEKQTLKKIFWFLLPFLVINFGLNHVYLKIMEKSRLNRVDKQFYSAPDHFRYLILGDSHIQRDVNPKYLDHSFNFSSVGESYIQNYYKLETILREQLKDIDAVILPVDLHSFSSYRLDRLRDSYYWIRYVNYVELGMEMHNLSSYLLRWIKGEFFPYSDGGKKNIVDFYTHKISEKIIDGHIPYKGNFARSKDTFQSAQIRVNFHMKGQDNYNTIMYDYFTKIVNLCKERHLQLILVRMPVTEAYYLLSTKFVDEKKLYEPINKLIAADENIFFLDYHDLFWEQDSLFYDPDHLNEIGAIQFSTKLNEQLVALDSQELPSSYGARTSSWDKPRGHRPAGNPLEENKNAGSGFDIHTSK